MNRAERIRHIITQRFSPGHLEVVDDSSKHAGHAGAAPGGETHYRLVVESEEFKGMSRVERHQAVYALLADELKNGLHALSIEARAPGERN